MNRTINLLVKQLVLAWIAASLFTVSNFTNVHAGLIVNGDFELHNVGFSSDYAFTEGVQPFPGLGGGQYNIVQNPSPFHFAAADYRDHTTGSGNMMMVNADWNLQNLIVWSQTATVEKNAVYEFSTWISTWAMAGDLNVSRLEVKVNVVSIGKHTAPSSRGVWEHFSASWESKNNRSATIQIYEIGREIGFPGGGNDFALDDINFHATSTVVPEPSSVLVFSLCLIYLRRARRCF
jgi:hypothetical protein